MGGTPQGLCSRVPLNGGPVFTRLTLGGVAPAAAVACCVCARSLCVLFFVFKVVGGNAGVTMVAAVALASATIVHWVYNPRWVWVCEGGVDVGGEVRGAGPCFMVYVFNAESLRLQAWM